MRYDTTRVREGPLIHAAQRSVLVSLYGPAGVPSRNVPDLYGSLIGAWRRRVVDLHAAGWPGCTDKRVKFLQGCPPFCVARSPKLHPCQSTACPFCHMRLYAMRPLAALTPSLLPHRRRRSVVAWVVRAAFVTAGEALYAAGDAGREVRALRPLSAAVYWRVTPGPRKVWVLRRAGLAVCVGTPGELPPDVRTHTYPGKFASLLEAGPRVFAYPRTTMRGDPARVVEALARQAGRRRLRLYGAAYGRAQEEAG